MRLSEILRVAITNCILVLFGIAGVHNKTGAGSTKGASDGASGAAGDDAEDKAKEATGSETEPINSDNPEIPSEKLEDMPENVQESYAHYESTDWEEGSIPEDWHEHSSAGKDWGNRDGDLPSESINGDKITYNEYDVNDCGGGNRDAERFVRGSDESVYYTNDHYHSFIKILK